MGIKFDIIGFIVLNIFCANGIDANFFAAKGKIAYPTVLNKVPNIFNKNIINV